MIDDEVSAMDLLQAEVYRQRYLADQIETASPEQRLLMLFAQLLADLDEAAEAFADRDIETINNSLQHAQQILFALRDPLDRETPLGLALSSTYTFCLNSLVQANLQKNPRELPRVQEMLGAIAAANRTAAAEVLARGRAGEFEGVA
jgi:flagellar protein FliS